MIKKIFRRVSKIVSSLYTQITLLSSRIVVGTNLTVNGSLWVEGTKNISIGSNVRINSGKYYNIIGGDTRTVFRTVGNGKISIGDGVGISNSCFVSTVGITIEDDVLIGGSCKFYDTDFHQIDVDDRMANDKTKIKSKPIRICKGAFVGAQSIILKGVTIGENSVVGAGSVVAKDIPANQIWAGNPARFVRNLYADSRNDE